MLGCQNGLGHVHRPCCRGGIEGGEVRQGEKDAAGGYAMLQGQEDPSVWRGCEQIERDQCGCQRGGFFDIANSLRQWVL